MFASSSPPLMGAGGQLVADSAGKTDLMDSALRQSAMS